MSKPKLVYFVAEDWYFCSHRLPLAVAAKKAGYDVTVVTRVRKHGDLIRSNGLKLEPFELARSGVNPFVEIGTLLRLLFLYKRLNPDIVHQVALKPVIYGTIIARLSGVKTVVNALAGMGWVYASNEVKRSLLRMLVEKALRKLLSNGKCIVQNQDDKKLLESIGVPSVGIRLIAGSGVDLDRYHYVPEPSGKPMVVLAARMIWDKGVGEFVEAARKLRAMGVDANFVLAGAPDPANPTSIPEFQLADWQREGVVNVLGFVKDMPSLYAQCHIVCLPTKYREGVPKALLEAMSAGRPVVTTDAPGCREIVLNGENGRLVPQRNVDALVGVLKELLENPNTRKRMGTRGREMANEGYSIHKVIRETLELY